MTSNIRGACPILNALSNAAIINQSGKNLNSESIIQIATFTKISSILLFMVISYIKMMNFFSFDKENFSLDDISNHHIVEHDNSIARYDYSEENKETYKTKINVDNLKEYLDLCRSDGFIYKEDILKLKNYKYDTKENSSYWFDKIIPKVEIDGFYKVFGKDDRILRDDFYEIFYNEKIPSHLLN